MSFDQHKRSDSDDRGFSAIGRSGSSRAMYELPGSLSGGGGWSTPKMRQARGGVYATNGGSPGTTPLGSEQDHLPSRSNSDRNLLSSNAPADDTISEAGTESTFTRLRRASTFGDAFSPETGNEFSHDTPALNFDERKAFGFVTNIFRLRGTVLYDIWTQIFSMAVLATVIAVIHEETDWDLSVPFSAHLSVGGVLGLLLVFRNNISHERYNEARLLLSQVKNGMRTIALLVHTAPVDDLDDDRLVQFKDDAKEVTKQLQVLFAAMVEDVRESREDAPTAPKLRPAPLPNAQPVKRSFRRLTQRVIESRRRNDTMLYSRYPAHIRPVIIAGVLTRMIAELVDNRVVVAPPVPSQPPLSNLRQKPLTGNPLRTMMGIGESKHRDGVLPVTAGDYALRLLHDEVMRGWENMVRIVTTPAPFLYRHMLAMLTFFFVFTTPFSMVGEYGYAMIPAALVICVGYYGVQQLAHELENPLGWDVNDIDLTGFQAILTEEVVTIHAHTFGYTAEQAAERLPSMANTFAATVFSVLADRGSELPREAVKRAAPLMHAPLDTRIVEEKHVRSPLSPSNSVPAGGPRNKVFSASGNCDDSFSVPKKSPTGHAAVAPAPLSSSPTAASHFVAGAGVGGTVPRSSVTGLPGASRASTSGSRQGSASSARNALGTSPAGRVSPDLHSPAPISNGTNAASDPSVQTAVRISPDPEKVDAMLETVSIPSSPRGAASPTSRTGSRLQKP